MSYSYINSDKIKDMLFNDSGYINEFCEAGIISLAEFKENYQRHLLDRNEKKLRKAGHKIKPGALMMGAVEVVEEYEHSKTLLHKEASPGELKKSVNRMIDICTGVQQDLSRLGESVND